MIDFDNEELKNSQEFRDWVNGLLREDNPVTVTFIKKDGTERVMKCTKNIANIPSDMHPKNEIAESTAIRVFDLENQGWRSFTPSSVKSIEFEIV